MIEPSPCLVSIILILLPVIPGFLFNFFAFVGFGVLMREPSTLLFLAISIVLVIYLVIYFLSKTREPSPLLVSIILILLPVIPGFLFNFFAFVGASIVGLAIVMYYFTSNLPWKGVKQAIVAVYFTGVFSLGLALGVFFALPIKPREFALVALVESIPFFISFAYLMKFILAKAISKDVLKVGNGYFAMLLVIIIGGLIGRFLHNFYELIILYSGFIALGIIAYLYFKE